MNFELSLEKKIIDKITKFYKGIIYILNLKIILLKIQYHLEKLITHKY